MIPKKYEEVKDKKLNQLRKDFKIQTILMYIVIVIVLIISFKGIKLSVECNELKQENENLRALTSYVKEE